MSLASIILENRVLLAKHRQDRKLTQSSINPIHRPIYYYSLARACIRSRGFLLRFLSPFFFSQYAFLLRRRRRDAARVLALSTYHTAPTSLWKFQFSHLRFAGKQVPVDATRLARFFFAAESIRGNTSRVLRRSASPSRVKSLRAASTSCDSTMEYFR